MPRGQFHEELEKMELQLLTMGELAANAVRSAVDAVSPSRRGFEPIGK